MARQENVNSIIGEGSVFEGKFLIHGSLLINGRFEGEIKTDDTLIIGETGRVKTDIVARRVIVGGTLIGNIKASQEVVLQETGRVLGDITAPKVTQAQGIVFQGKMIITGNQKKPAKNIIEEAFTGGTPQSVLEKDEKASSASAKKKKTPQRNNRKKR